MGPDLTTAWDALRERTGVQCRLHDLRHTAATHMAEAGVPESPMRAIVGHMSIAMLERYSHVRMAAKRDAIKSLAFRSSDRRSSSATARNLPKNARKRRFRHCRQMA